MESDPLELGVVAASLIQEPAVRESASR
jgi:hypothetical protein